MGARIRARIGARIRARIRTSAALVLAPLSEVAPDWILPGQEKTIETLWLDMKESQSNLGLSRLT